MFNRIKVIKIVILREILYELICIRLFKVFVMYMSYIYIGHLSFYCLKKSLSIQKIKTLSFHLGIKN